MNSLRRIAGASFVVLALLAAITSTAITSTAGAPSVLAAPATSGPQYGTTPTGERFLIPAGSKPDAVAFYQNGFQPVLVPSGKLTPSSLGHVPTERGPDRVIPDCLQPPANLDLLHTSATLLQAYGIAPRTPEEPLSKWLAINSHAKHHICSSYNTNAAPDATYTPPVNTGPLVSVEFPDGNWAGKIADLNCVSQLGLGCYDGSHYYTETDSDYYVNCPTVSDPAIGGNVQVGEWSGLGGFMHGSELEQDGVGLNYFTLPGGFSYTETYAFYEYIGPDGSVGPQNLNLQGDLASCHDHMYTKMYNNNCSVIIDLTKEWNYDWCTGPQAGHDSAELIEELASGNGVPRTMNTTFYGAGVTDYYNGDQYWGYGTIQHDYVDVANPLSFSPADLILQTGPIENDPGDVPYDQYTVSIVHPCGGYSSC